MRRLAVPFSVLALALLLPACSADVAATMPDVVGMSLDTAISDVERAGFDDEVEVLGGGMFGVLDESNWQVCDQSPAAGAVVDKPRLTVDRSCDDGSTDEGAQEPEQDEAEADADTYTYIGPKYEVVAVDENVSAAQLKQHWVYLENLDNSTDAYKAQVKLIISDIAHAEGTEKLIVQVVTDKEIIQAESVATIASFMDEHGGDYFRDVVAPKEKTGWVAWYTGGFDYDMGEPSDDTFAIDWWVASDNPETENWAPVVSG